MRRTLGRLREYVHGLLFPADPPSHPWAKAIPLAPRKQHLLALLLLALPIVSYWIHVLLFTANAPYLDDYEVLLDSTNRFVSTPGLAAKLSILWAQHNEHRLVVPRLLALGQYYVFGHISLRHLAVLANLGWTASFAWIVRQHGKRVQLPLLFYVPLACLWFSLVQQENIFWAMGGMQNFGAVLFSILALKFLLDGKPLATCLACAAGVLTSMVGWPVFALCIGLALARRSFRQAAALAGTAVVLAALYFHNYAPALGHPIPSMALLDFEATLAFGLAVMGSTLRFAGYSIVLGWFSLLALLYLLFFGKPSPWSFGLALLALAQTASIAIGRGGYGGEHYAGALISSRFTTASLVTAAAIYLMLLDSLEDSQRAFKTLLLSCLLAGTYAIAMTGKLDVFADLARDYAARSNTLASCLPHTRCPLICNQASETCETILLRSQGLGVFDYTTAVSLAPEPVPHLASLSPNLTMASQIDFYDGARIQGWALNPGTRSTTCTTHLVLAKDPQHSYWIPTRKTHRPEASVAQHVQFDYDMAGFEAFPALYRLPPEDYRVGIAITTSRGLALEWTNYTYRPVR